MRRVLKVVLTPMWVILATLGALLSMASPATATLPPELVISHTTVQGFADGTVTINGVRQTTDAIPNYPEKPWHFGTPTFCVWQAFSTNWPMQTAASRWGTNASAVAVTSQVGPTFPANLGCEGFNRNQEVWVYYNEDTDKQACWTDYVDWYETTGEIIIANVTINTRTGCSYPSGDPSIASIYRAHAISASIGVAAGLAQLSSDVRVMGNTNVAKTQVPYATLADGEQLNCRLAWTSC